MPKPKAGESEQDYISRCIPMVMKEGKTQEQAAGQCYGMWRGRKNAIIENPTQAEQEMFDKESKEHPSFTDEQVWQIVRDHFAERKNSAILFRTNAVKQALNECVCNFLQPGVVSYEDVGAGVALLEKEAIELMLPSFIGKPVIIDHQDGTPEELEEKGKAVGHVVEAYWNPETGWFDAKFTVEDEKAKKKIKHGYSVSCAFNVKSVDKGGEWHAVKYDEEITDGEFVHLALVANPRYEDCEIQMLVNSKKAKIEGTKASNDLNLEYLLRNIQDLLAKISETMRGNSKEKSEAIAKLRRMIRDYAIAGDKDQVKALELEIERVEKSTLNNKEKKNMFNWFKNKKKNDEGEEIDITKAVVDVDGEKVPVSELIKYKKAEEAEEKKMTELGLNDEIEHDGGRHKIADMVDGYRKAKFGFDPKAKKMDDDKKKNGTTEKGDPIPADADMVNDDKKKNEVIEPAKPEGPKSDKGAGAVSSEEKNNPKENVVIEPKKSENPKACDKDIEKGTVINDEEKKEECDDDKKNDDKKKNDDEAKKKAAEGDKKEHDSDKKKNDDEEKKETIKEENTKKNVKWFKKLNALREEGEEQKATFNNSLKDRLDRGKAQYGTVEKK